MPAEAVRRRRRLAVLAGMLGGTLVLLLRRPSPTTPEFAYGQHSHTPSDEALGEGWEVKDLSARGLGYVLAVLGGSAIALVGFVVLMVWVFGVWDRARYASLAPEQTAPVTPPGPHLLVHPSDELAQVLAREARQLNTYAWIDPQHTRARIPISRAMALVQGQSLDAAP